MPTRFAEPERCACLAGIDVLDAPDAPSSPERDALELEAGWNLALRAFEDGAAEAAIELPGLRLRLTSPASPGEANIGASMMVRPDAAAEPGVVSCATLSEFAACLLSPRPDADAFYKFGRLLFAVHDGL